MASSPAPTVAAPRPTNIRWVVFALGCGCSWILYLHRYTWNFVNPYLQSEQGLSQADIGFLSTVFNAAYGLGQIPIGVACDRFGAHALLGMMILLWSACLALLGFNGGYGLVFMQRIGFGLGQSGCYPVLAKVSHVWFPHRIRTFLQGWMASFCGRLGGAMSSYILATVLVGSLGMTWREGLWVMAAGGLLFGAAFLVLYRGAPTEDPRVNEAERALLAAGRPADSGDHPAVLPWRRAARSGNLWRIVVMQNLSAGADTFYSVFLGLYFLKAFGLSIEKAGLSTTVALLGGAIGGAVAGAANDLIFALTGSRRWSRSLIGMLGPGLAAAVLLGSVARADTAVSAAVGLFFVKFFVDMSQPTVWGACTDIGGRYSATVLSIVNSSSAVVASLCPWLFGKLLDAFQTEAVADTAPTLNFQPLFWVLATMYLTAGAIWLTIDCTRTLDTDPTSAAPTSADHATPGPNGTASP